MKKLSLALLLSLLTGAAYADHHEEAGPFYAFYHMNVPNPPALIEAMDRFWASECGARYPADVGLLQEVFNGGYSSTHFVINTFANAKDQQTASEVLRSCPDGLRFLGELQAAGVQQVAQYIGLAPIDANDWGQDEVFAKFDIIVDPEDQAAYAQAYAKMMAEVGEDIELRSYGLGAVGFGRDKFTHWIWTGAESIEALSALSQKISAHPAYIEFNKEVGNLREVVNVSQIQTLKVYPKH